MRKQMNPGASANARGARNKVSACGSTLNKNPIDLQRIRANWLADRFGLDAARAALLAEHAFATKEAADGIL